MVAVSVLVTRNFMRELSFSFLVSKDFRRTCKVSLNNQENSCMFVELQEKIVFFKNRIRGSRNFVTFAQLHNSSYLFISDFFFCPL